MKRKPSIHKGLVLVILIIVAANTALIGWLTSTLNIRLAEAMELRRPARLQATLITAPDCGSCFDIETAYENIRAGNVVMESEKRLVSGSADADTLIERYAIQKLPTIILTGEIRKDSQLEKAWEAIGEIRDDAVVFTALRPPYFDTAESRIRGRVTAIYINDKDCAECPTFEGYVSQLKQGGMAVTEERTLDYRDSEAKELIGRYNIDHVPTFLLDQEMAVYDELVANWSKIGRVAEDGNYIATPVLAPFRNLTTGQVEGLISATYITDANCSECMGTDALKNLFTRFGLKYKEEQTVDALSREGAELIDHYKINFLPTLILDAEADAYPALKQVWPQIGTTETDGSYVVRNLSVVRGGRYKDLTSGKLLP